MNDVLLLKLLHLLGFAYWLGGDLGVFYSSFTVANERLQPETRVLAAKTLFALDMVPRICMTMMLPLGVTLAAKMGALPVSVATLVFTWLICCAWLGWVAYQHWGGSDAAKRWLTKVDYTFRAAVIAALLASGLAALTGVAAGIPHWIALKLLIFAVMMACGFAVRVVIRPFGPAFAQLAAGEIDAAGNAAIRSSLGRTKPFVIVIWVGLIASAALGIHLF